MTFFIYMLVYYSLFLAFDESLLSSCQALMMTSCTQSSVSTYPPGFKLQHLLSHKYYISASSLG